MFSGHAKKIVIIKDIPSNVIEEAILILKPDSDVKNGSKKGKDSAGLKRDNDYLVKEAEMIINNYIKGSKMNNEPSKVIIQNPKTKLNPQRKKFITNLVINTALIGSITLLILLVSRVM